MTPKKKDPKPISDVLVPPPPSPSAAPTPRERPAPVVGTFECDVCGLVTDSAQCPIDGKVLS